MQHFYGSHSFLLFGEDMDDLFPYRFVTRLAFSLRRPAETAPGTPVLTSLSVSLLALLSVYFAFRLNRASPFL